MSTLPTYNVSSQLLVRKSRRTCRESKEDMQGLLICCSWMRVIKEPFGFSGLFSQCSFIVSSYISSGPSTTRCSACCCCLMLNCLQCKLYLLPSGVPGKSLQCPTAMLIDRIKQKFPYSKVSPMKSSLISLTHFAILQSRFWIRGAKQKYWYLQTPEACGSVGIGSWPRGREVILSQYLCPLF